MLSMKGGIGGSSGHVEASNQEFCKTGNYKVTPLVYIYSVIAYDCNIKL